MPGNNLLSRVNLLTVFCAVLLAGCGGGGGGGGAEPGPNPPPPTPTPPPPCGGWTGTLELSSAGSHSSITHVEGIGSCSFIVAGYQNSTHPGEPLGDTRGFLRQYSVDAQGRPQQQWEHLLDTVGTDAIHGFDVGPDLVRFWGSTSGAIDGATNAGIKDVILGALTRAGALTKLSQIGNERPNIPLRLLALNADARVLIGNDEVYVPTNYVEAWEDPWMAGVMEYPGFFELDRIENRSTPSSDFYTDATLFGETVVVAVRSEELSERGISLRRQQPFGSELWNLSLTTNLHDNIASMHAGQDAILVFGTTYEQLGDDAFGAGDYFLAEVEADTGQLNWLEQLGTATTDWASVLLVTAEGYTLVGEVPDANGNWSAVVIELAVDLSQLSNRPVVMGQSLGVTSAARLAEGVIVGGTVHHPGGISNGFVHFLPDQG